MMVVLAIGFLAATAMYPRRMLLRRLGALDVPPAMWEHHISETLLIGLVSVLMRSGASVHRALDVVGGVVDDSRGDCLMCVVDHLRSGIAWDEAWELARIQGFDLDGLSLLREGLRSTWVDGSPPAAGLDEAIARSELRARSASSSAASRLSVRLLMPVGLCMLPSFICLAVIPAIVSVVSS
ncbi:type II secretion system F family protein [uncultured Bifidobacterium sp.]|uniref:type II secretion system F family protein n=1 Tax=uncultured Bifidobacterium sp. TaxID=165187 RepID=UPI002620DFBC|nr:type II secretion system F family protein [uncultured Bifidobacterium sp.]